VSLALFGANAGSYLLTVVAARAVTSELFGELSALLALLVVGVVPSMGLQTAVALRVAGDLHERPGGAGATLDRAATARLFGLGLAVAGGIGALVLAASPGLAVLLHLSSMLSALWLAVALAPLTLLGLFHGLLQGAQRFRTLALLVALEGVGKVGGALAGLLAFGSPDAALAGIAVGSVLVGITGWQLCGRPRPARPAGRQGSALLHAISSILGLVLLVNLDLVLARHFLPAGAAGRYAVGSVLTKVAYWLPQAVGVLVLPRLAQAGQRRRALTVAAAVVGGLGAVTVTVTAVGGPLLLRAVGGARYGAMGFPAWPFALVGALLAVVQLLLFAGIAAADRRSSLAVWTAVLAEIALVALHFKHSPTEIVGAAAVSAAALTVAGAVLQYNAWRRDARTEAATAHPHPTAPAAPADAGLAGITGLAGPAQPDDQDDQDDQQQAPTRRPPVADDYPTAPLHLPLTGDS
jgi:hypothetical protein